MLLYAYQVWKQLALHGGLHNVDVSVSPGDKLKSTRAGVFTNSHCRCYGFIGSRCCFLRGLRIGHNQPLLSFMGPGWGGGARLIRPQKEMLAAPSDVATATMTSDNSYISAMMVSRGYTP